MVIAHKPCCDCPTQRIIRHDHLRRHVQATARRPRRLHIQRHHLRGFWLTCWLERDERTTPRKACLTAPPRLHRRSRRRPPRPARRSRDVPPPSLPAESPRRHGGRRRPHHPHLGRKKFSFVSDGSTRVLFPSRLAPRRARRGRMAYLIDRTPLTHTPTPAATPGMAHLGPRPTRRPSSRSRREDVAFAHERSHSRAHERKRLRHRADVGPEVVRGVHACVRRDGSSASERGFDFARVRAGARAKCEFSALCASRATREEPSARV